MGNSHSVDAGGYYDSGWGLFVISEDSLNRAPIVDNFREVSLGSLDAIVLPTPIVGIVKKYIPKHASLIKGYHQYAEELKSRT